MGKTIIYKKGDILGKNHIIYLEERPKKHNNRRALFQCTCGNKWETTITNVKRNTASSCGCYAKKENSKRFKKHGLSKHPLAARYYHMMSRVYNPSHKNYLLYKDRLVEPYLQKLENYIEYVGNLPNALERNLTVDREDNKLGYIRGNLKWVDDPTQQGNRNNKDEYTGVRHIKNVYIARLVHKGKTYCIGTFKTSKWACFARNRFIVENGFPHKIQQIKV